MIRSSTRSRFVRAGWLAAGALLLLGVFSLYGRPTFLMSMIEQLWSCF